MSRLYFVRYLSFCLVALSLLGSVTAQSGTAQPGTVQSGTAQPAATQPGTQVSAGVPADAELAAIRFEGVSDPTTESLMRVRLTSRPGVRVSDIDLPAERNRILGSGTFSEVSLSVENRPVGPVLFVRVKENPPIREVVLRGITFLDLPQIRKILLQENLLGAGQIYNTTRAQEAVNTLQSIYSSPQIGFPGQIPVTLSVQPVAKGTPAAGTKGATEPPPAANTATNTAANAETTDTNAATPADPNADPATASVPLENAAAVRLVYTVNETPPVDTLTFAGETVVPEGDLNTLFRPVVGDKFSLNTYQSAVQGVADAYTKLGFRGSGVDRAATRLVDGTLSVQINELKILSLDTTAIGIDPAKFSLQPGELYNYDTLLADVGRLAPGAQRRYQARDPAGW